MDPPEPLIAAAFAGLSILLSAVVAGASAALHAVPHGRKAALLESLEGAQRTSMERYLARGPLVESSWLLLRAAGIALGALLLTSSLPDQSATLVIGILLAAYGVLAELLSAGARQRAERVMPKALVLLRPLEWLVWPFCFPVGALAQLLGGLVHKAPAPSPSLVESEVEILVNEGELNGSLAHDQSEMIRNVLDFGDIRAGDIMVPRTAVTAVDVDLSIKDFLKLVAEKEHSRYPVYRERIDNVIGVLHVKDLITRSALEDVEKLQLSDLMRTPIMYVPASQLASSVLTEMRAGRHHMATVIDEFGGMSGIITLEDLIEEIVGDIRDEHDHEEPPIVDLGEGRLLVQASVPINDLSRYLGTDLPEETEYNSLGGFIVERMGRVPKAGESIEQGGLTLVVREADERHVAKVEIVRPEPAPGKMSSAPPPRPAA